MASLHTDLGNGQVLADKYVDVTRFAASCHDDLLYSIVTHLQPRFKGEAGVEPATVDSENRRSAN